MPGPVAHLDGAAGVLAAWPSVVDRAGWAVHLAAALVGVLAVAAAGARLAERAGQPRVIGEVVAGLALGPAALAVLGPGGLDALLPGDVLAVLRPLGHLGLVLFLVGVAHDLRVAGARHEHGRGVLARAVAGSFVVPLAAGVLLALGIVASGDPATRGSAPAPAFVVLVATALSVTAVPVLARFLADRGLGGSVAGRLAMSAAVLTDTGAWLLLTAAVGLARGSTHGVMTALVVLVLAGVGALALHALLRTRPSTRLCRRFPAVAAAGVVVLAVTGAHLVEEGGLTAILGAFAVGLAVPRGAASPGHPPAKGEPAGDPDAGAPWAAVVGVVARQGLRLVPLFFVVTGVSALARPGLEFPWALCLVITAAGLAAKVLGTFAATVGALPALTAARVGVLMNMRGLTELVLLQAGLAAGILTTALFAAMTVMAVVTTLLTGPLLAVCARLGGVAHPMRWARQWDEVPRSAADTV